MSDYKLFTQKKSDKTGAYFEHWADVQVSANDQDPLAVELVNNLRNFEGSEYDNGEYRYRVSSSQQFGSTIWRNESKKAKGESKQEQKKQNDDERNKKIQEMADKRDQKFDELIVAINNLKQSLEDLTAAIVSKT